MRKEPLTVTLLINYLYDWYKETSIKKMRTSEIPVVTATIIKKYFSIIAAVKLITSQFTRLFELRLRQLVFDLVKTVNEEFHMKKNQAPFISLRSARKVTKYLWTVVPKGRGFSKHSRALRQEAALHLLLSAVVGGRWTDVGALHWDDMTRYQQSHGTYIRIMIRRSKNNQQ